MKYFISLQNTEHYLRAATVMMGLALLLLISSCAELARMRNPNLDLEIQGPVTISDEWFEITPQEPLKAERELSQIVLWFAEHTKVCSPRPRGIVGNDGAVFEPEVELVDERGGIYKLKEDGLDETGMSYRWFGENNSQFNTSLPKDKTYIKVRIKSLEPIKCSSVVWRNYNTRDSK